MTVAIRFWGWGLTMSEGPGGKGKGCLGLIALYLLANGGLWVFWHFYNADAHQTMARLEPLVVKAEARAKDLEKTLESLEGDLKALEAKADAAQKKLEDWRKRGTFDKKTKTVVFKTDADVKTADALAKAHGELFGKLVVLSTGFDGMVEQYNKTVAEHDKNVDEYNKAASAPEFYLIPIPLGRKSH